MIYHDPSGRPISRESWRKLFAKPENVRYSRLMATPRVVIDIIWIGLALASEKKKKLWMIEAVPVDDLGNPDPCKGKPVAWASCKAEALQRAREARLQAEMEELHGE